MDYSLFQKLTESELDKYINEIDIILEFHVKWLSEVSRALICTTDTDLQQVQLTLYNDKYFDRWYNNMQESDLIEMPEFKVLDNLHLEMLDLGKKLVTSASEKQIIATSDYDKFTSVASELRHMINGVKGKIKFDLKLVAKLMGKVFENAEECVMITDVNSIILNVNQAFVKVTQYSKKEVVGKKPSILHSGNHDKHFYERMWRVLLRDHRWQGEIWNKRKNNDIYPECLTITAVMDDNGTISHFIGIFTDVSVVNGSGDDRLYHLAHYDSLCDLPNRMLFYDRLRQALSRSKRSNHKIAVMFMDLDGFKGVNDEFGHSVGDELLQQVSKRVVTTLRESDTIARIGGDEFTLIINDINDKETIAKIANKILFTLRETYCLHGNEFNISASIGVSIYPDDSEDIDMLVKQSDIAMYKAKNEGKNRFKFFDISMG